MKKHCYALLCIIFILSLSAGGCSNSSKEPAEIKKTVDNSGPSNIEYSFDGYYGALDGDIAAVCGRDSIQIFDLKNNKLKNEMQFKEYSILGLDISGDIVVWAETVSQNNTEEANVYIYNYRTNEKKQIAKDIAVQSRPRIWENYVVYQDNRNDKTKERSSRWSLYLYNLDTEEKREITSTLSVYAAYSINDDKIVWEDDRGNKASDTIRGGGNVPENNKNIYLYDIKTGKESAVATGPYMECNPDIDGGYIVYEDRNNNTIDADIVLYDINSKESFYLTKDEFDQGTPRIYEGYVVWMDERRGISTNDVYINGKAPNSDIVLYHIDSKTERILTGDEPQILPCISSEWVSFVLSRQAEPKVQLVRYNLHCGKHIGYRGIDYSADIRSVGFK